MMADDMLQVWVDSFEKLLVMCGSEEKLREFVDDVIKRAKRQYAEKHVVDALEAEAERLTTETEKKRKFLEMLKAKAGQKE
jgi:hypothetical protein